VDIASTKKVDSLMTATQAIPDNVVLQNSFNIPAIGANPTTFIFSPTLRDRDTADDTFGQSNSRNTSDCFIRGFKERIRFVTSEGNEWIWRRICFTYKGTRDDFNVPGMSFPNALPYHFDPVQTGYRRLWSKLDGAAITGEMQFVRDRIYEKVFKGARNIDWSNAMTAPTDSKTVKIWYDKTTTVKGGNEQSHFVMANRWHAINRTLNYEDKEAGKDQTSFPWSVQSRGLGDYYVMDMFYTAPVDDGVILDIQADASVYWHER